MGGGDTQLTTNMLRQTGLPRKPRGPPWNVGGSRQQRTWGKVDMGPGYDKPSSDPGSSSLSKLKGHLQGPE